MTSRVATLLADCYANLGQDDKAIATLKPEEAAHPDDLSVAWLLGSALIRAGHRREGLDLVDRVAREGNRPEAYLLAGRTALKMNEFERARDYAAAAARLNPQLPGLDTLRGTVLSYLGDTDGAAAMLRKAVEADPKDFDAQLGLGAVLHTNSRSRRRPRAFAKRLATQTRLHGGALRMGPPGTYRRTSGSGRARFREGRPRRPHLGPAAR